MQNEKNRYTADERDEPAAEAGGGDSEREEFAGRSAEPDGENHNDAGNEEASLEEALAAAKEESKTNYERYLRSVAELENFRRRSSREKEEMRKHAASSLVEDLLPVLDNFALGLESVRDRPGAGEVVKGFEMVRSQIESILRDHGLEEIHPEGEPFDPHRHDSTAYEPHEDLPEGAVVKVIRKGYVMNGKLLRPALVVVSSGAPDSGDPGAEEQAGGGAEGSENTSSDKRNEAETESDS